MLRILCSLAVLFTSASHAQDFQSPSTVEETRQQLKRLPKDDIWWVVNGKDMRWNNKNLHRIMPTVNVYREGAVKELELALNPDIASFGVNTPQGQMGFKDFLDSKHSASMGVVILHKGKIVFEHYPQMEPYEKPVYWSVAKVLVSSVVGILEDRGEVDISKPIDMYIPALKNSSYAGVTVRNILDMAPGIDCGDGDYYDKTSCYYQYSVTVGDGFWQEGSPDDPYKYVAEQKMKKYVEQGKEYQYSGVSTFLLSWLVEELMDMPFQDAFSKEIWSKIGAESDAAFMAPRNGQPITHGGFLARPRDVARFGLLYTPSSKIVSDQKIISDRLINLIRDGGRAHIKNGNNPDVKYSIYQWDAIFKNNDFFKGGWAGQGLLVNPDKDLVAVYTGYIEKDTVPLLPRLRAVLNGVYSAK